MSSSTIALTTHAHRRYQARQRSLVLWNSTPKSDPTPSSHRISTPRIAFRTVPSVFSLPTHPHHRHRLRPIAARTAPRPGGRPSRLRPTLLRWQEGAVWVGVQGRDQPGGATHAADTNRHDPTTQAGTCLCHTYMRAHRSHVHMLCIIKSDAYMNGCIYLCVCIYIILIYIHIDRT